MRNLLPLLAGVVGYFLVAFICGPTSVQGAGQTGIAVINSTAVPCTGLLGTSRDDAGHFYYLCRDGIYWIPATTPTASPALKYSYSANATTYATTAALPPSLTVRYLSTASRPDPIAFIIFTCSEDVTSGCFSPLYQFPAAATTIESTHMFLPQTNTVACRGLFFQNEYLGTTSPYSQGRLYLYQYDRIFAYWPGSTFWTDASPSNYQIPNSFGSLPFRFTSHLIFNGTLLMGTDSGVIVKFNGYNLSSSPFACSPNPTACGADESKIPWYYATGGRIYTMTGYTSPTGSKIVFLGGSLGLVSWWDALARRLQGISLISSGYLPIVNSFLVDGDAQALFASVVTSDGANSTVVRLGFGSISEFTIPFDSIQMGGTTAFLAQMVPSGPYLAVIGNTTTGFESSLVQVATCSQYPCATCGAGGDPSYCRYCADTGLCGFIQGRDGSCSAAVAPNVTTPSCPGIIRPEDKPSGSTDGGTVLKFSAQNLYPAPGSYQILFGPLAEQATVLNVTAAQITFAAPSYTIASFSYEVGIDVRFQGTSLIAPVVYFDYYKCTGRACSTNSDGCFAPAAKECGFCFRQGICTSEQICTGPQGNFCPTVTGLSPQHLLYTSTGPVTITINQQLPAGENYQCKFGELYFAALQVPNTTSLYCTISPAPSPTVPPNDPRSVGVAIGTTLITTLNTQPTMEFYDCSSFDSCYNCLADHDQCKFCDLNVNDRCMLTSGSGCSASGDASAVANCPKITSLSATSFHISATGTVDVVTNTVLTGMIECKWVSPPPGSIAQTVNASSINGTVAICPLPNFGAEDGQWQVSLLRNGPTLTDIGLVKVYKCDTPDAVQTCTACRQAGPMCAWCLDDNTCGFGCSSLPVTLYTCPSLGSLIPSEAEVGTPLAVNVDLFPAPLNVIDIRCLYGSGGAAQNLTATLNNATVTCDMPAISEPQTSPLTVVVNDKNYAPSRFFSFFNCDKNPSGVALSCSECTSRPQCGWCGAGCGRINGTCLNSTSQCTSVQSVYPSFAQTSSATLVTVTVSRTIVPDPNVVYFCSWGLDNLQAEAYLVQNSPSDPTDTLTCTTPVTLNAAVGSATYRLSILKSAFNANPTPYTDIPINFDFFTCGSSNPCGVDCVRTPHCGWCAQQSLCTGAASCGQSNFWTNTTNCPAIVTTPNHVQVPLTSVNLTAPAAENLHIALINGYSVTYYPGEVKCHWQQLVAIDTTATANPANNSWSCPIPAFTAQGFYALSVLYYPTPSSAPSILGTSQMQAVDCLPFSLSCEGSCTLSLPGRCGWCSGSSKCLTQSWCGAQEITKWSSATCPDLRDITPGVAVTTGGDVITLTSDAAFVNSTFYSVQIGEDTSNLIPATWVDSNSITFTAPSLTAGDYDVFLWHNGSRYTSDKLTLTVNEPAQDVTPIAAGVAVPLGVMLIAAAIALIYMYKRKIGFFYDFVLKEPDYAEVAFGAMRMPIYKTPKDKWEKVAVALLQKNTGFVVAVAEMTGSTEQDPVARSFVHFYQYHGKGAEMLSFLIIDEVARTLDENTIFRSNSLASKYFKFYSKVVGIKYLFRTLCRFCVELQGLAAKKEAEAGNESGGSNRDTNRSFLSIELEVDPEQMGNNSFADNEANVYQLALACQKVFSTVRGSMKEMPVEFLSCFQTMNTSCMGRFGNQDAVFKAVGGFLFLRFIGPALCAPHAYGLLPGPPNRIAQRQLVLISKIVQTLANLAKAGAKEDFMLQMNDFLEKNIPKMRQFYTDLLALDVSDKEDTAVVDVPEIARENALGYLYEHILTNEVKLATTWKKLYDEERAQQLDQLLADLKADYKMPSKVEDPKRRSSMKESGVKRKDSNTDKSLLKRSSVV